MNKRDSKSRETRQERTGAMGGSREINNEKVDRGS